MEEREREKEVGLLWTYAAMLAAKLGSKEPEDVAQDAVLAWLKGLRRAQVLCSKSFVRRVVRNLVALEFRKRRQNPSQSDEAIISAAHAPALLDERVIDAVLHGAPPSLISWLDLDQEAGQALDATNRQRKCRAMRWVKNMWDSVSQNET